MLEFPTEFELHKIAADLQQIMQWFGYDVAITCEVITKDKLNDIEQDRGEPNLCPSLVVTGKKLKLPLSVPRKGYPKYCKLIGGPCKPTNMMIGVYCVQKY